MEGCNCNGKKHIGLGAKKTVVFGSRRPVWQQVCWREGICKIDEVGEQNSEYGAGIGKQVEKPEREREREGKPLGPDEYHVKGHPPTTHSCVFLNLVSFAYPSEKWSHFDAGICE